MAKTSQNSSQTCSTAELEDALKVLEGRWKVLIIFHLFRAPVLRFSELRRAIPGVSQKMLIQQLRDLEVTGVVVRKVYPEVPPKVEYALTEEGLALRPALVALQLWAASRKGNLSNPPTNISAANLNESETVPAKPRPAAKRRGA